MYILKHKSKGTVLYSLAQSVYNPDTKRNTSKVVEKIGTEEELQKKLGKDVDIQKWLKDYAKKKTEEQKEQSKNSTLIEYRKNKRRNRDQRHIKNLGYLYIKQVLIELGIDKFCKKISKKEKLKYDFFIVLSNYIYSCIMGPILGCEELNTTLEYYASCLLQKVDFKLPDVIDSLKMISKYSTEFMNQVYKSIKQKSDNKNNRFMYYKCCQCSIAIDLFYYSLNFSHPKNLLDLLHVFFDEDGYICSFFEEETYASNCKIDNKFFDYLKEQLDDPELYILPNSSASNNLDSIKTAFPNSKYIINPSISGLKKYLTEEEFEWFLNDEDWREYISNRKYNILDVVGSIIGGLSSAEEKARMSCAIFYKNKVVEIDNPQTKEKKKQRIVCFYSYLSDIALQHLRNDTIINMQSSLRNKIQYLDQEHLPKINSKLLNITNEELFADDDYKPFYYFDTSFFREGEKHDGKYIYSIEPDLDFKDILHVLYLVEGSLDYMLIHGTTDTFGQRANITFDETINSFYTIRSIAYNMINYMIKKSNNTLSITEIVDTINSINFCKASNKVWKSSYTPYLGFSYRVMDMLKEITGLDLDFDFIDNKEMNNLVK